jgi:hypothetical protein
VRQLAAYGFITLADKGYIGAGEHVRVPYRGRNKPASQKAANRAHSQLRSPAERANAQLKTWRILRKLRCCPGAPGSSPKPSTSSRPARSKDEKGSLNPPGRILKKPSTLAAITNTVPASRIEYYIANFE